MSPLKRNSVIVIAIACLLATGIGGYQVGHMVGRDEAEQSADVARLEQLMRGLVTTSRNTPERRAISEKYWQTWDAIRANYLYQDQVSDEKLLLGSLSGMVKALEDPYSEYMGPAGAQAWTESLSGQFAGIGAVLDGKGERPVVQKIIPHSPAAQTGLRPGDRILAVDGTDTKGVSIEDNVKKIRGEIGTKVRLTLERPGAKNPVDLTIERGEVKIPSVELKMESRRGKRIAVVTLAHFQTGTAAELEAVADRLLAAHADGIVLDLRNDPGGLLPEVIAATGLWVGEVVVVSERRANGLVKHHSPKTQAKLGKLPTVVLVNGHTASASEIMAGAMKELDVGFLVGEKTFGKGVVQYMSVDEKDGSMLKLTVCEWLTPHGNSINKKGIEPDVKVELTKEDLAAGRDPQMDAALGHLLPR